MWTIWKNISYIQGLKDITGAKSVEGENNSTMLAYSIKRKKKKNDKF